MARLKLLRDQLTLEEKISLLAGVDAWQTQDIPRLGIGSLKTTDGPAGARGGLSVDGPSAAFVPAPVAQAATWSKEHLHAIGQLLCREAKTKAAQVLLAPTICCARNPLGGRNFESYSEDPYLSGQLAIQYVRGVQETGEVAATVKHFVANEQEYQRFTINAEISDRALREIYLRPFEMVIKSKQAPKCVMTSYNCVNGTHMDASNILQDILREEWGFKGLVMSDWGGTNSVIESVIAGCDLEMPGPPEKRGAQLLQAVNLNGSAELLEAIDRSSLRILQLLDDLHLLDMSPAEAEKSRHGIETSSDNKHDQELLRQVAADGIVLLKNNSRILPLDPRELSGKKIAFLGPNALNGTPGGGGSATMVPPYQTQPFAAFRSVLKKLGVSADIQHSPGAFIHKWLPLTSTRQFSAAPSESMLKLEFFGTEDLTGPILEIQHRDSSYVDLFDSAPAAYYEDKKPHSLRITSKVTPETTGKHLFGLSSVGNARLFVNDELIIDNENWNEVGEAFYAFGSVEVRASIQMDAGQTYEVRIEASTRIIPGTTNSDDPVHVFGVQPSVRIGFLEQLPEDPVADAVILSNNSDLTIVIIGLNDEWESEGYDRQSMKLPGGQDILIETLLAEAKHPENIIVVNQSGSPVEMSWAPKVDTILQAWYGGQEAGNALADVLLGIVNPSGKLPITWPMSYEDLAFENKTWPGVNGVVRYEEANLVGYRWYIDRKISPRWWLGHGLSFTTFNFSESIVVRNQDGWEVSVVVKNTGLIPGREVVQCYVLNLNGSEHIGELKAFHKTSLLNPEMSEKLSMTVMNRDLAYWDMKGKRWILEAGLYELCIGRNAGDMVANLQTLIPNSLSYAE
ncbi:glycosyl hydrolase family 3 N terminal domain-containing protein [Phlyctema vagabunda]|uniref:beta-glucosidase n=1 Tax=Phlyctema vagabunda TaxID=108571 RepID=A0ABR4P8A7_9HELO